MPANHKRKKRLAHIVAAFVIFLHAYEKYESGHDSFIYFGIAGVIVMIVAVFHTKLQSKIPWIDSLFFVIEGFLSIVMAIDYFHLEKKWLPYVYLLVALIQFYLALRKSKITDK